MSYFPVVCFTVPCFRAQRPCVPVSAGIRITVFIYPERAGDIRSVTAPSELPTELYFKASYVCFQHEGCSKRQRKSAEFLDMYFSENALWWTQRKKYSRWLTKTKHWWKIHVEPLSSMEPLHCTNVSYKGKSLLKCSSHLQKTIVLVKTDLWKVL